MILQQASRLPDAAIQRPRQRSFRTWPPITGRLGRAQQRAHLPRGLVASASQDQPGAVTATADSRLPVPAGKFEVTLRGMEALQTMRFGLVPQGKGQAVVVTGVAEGSQAEELGVRRGQKLNALSDPMRYGEMWSLQDRPSLRFVVDTFKMRRSQPIDLEFEPLLTETDMEAIFGGADAAAAANGSYSGSASIISPASAAAAAPSSGATAGSSGEKEEDTVPDGAASSISSIDQLMGTVTSGSDSDSEFAGLTIGERLAAKRAASLKAQMANNQVQARIERRKAYMEVDDQRDDTGLLLGLAAAFLLPPAIGLAIAYFTGYLDRLYFTTLTLT